MTVTVPESTGKSDRIDRSAPPPAGVVAIPVSGYVVLIDEVDLELVSGYSWRVHRHKRTGKLYACTRVGRKNAMMHRLIAGTPKGFDTDHANTDSLDNRRSNLRPATRSQNNINREKHSTHAGKPTTSRWKGVHWDAEKRKWRAMIRVDGKLIRLGRFDSEIDAARAYNVAVLEYFPEFARPNVIPEDVTP